MGWFCMAWPPLLRSNTKAECCGMAWKYKLTFLELVGHMLHLICFLKEVANRPAVTRIDNSGSVWNAQRGYNLKCNTVDTLLYAMVVVAGGLNCHARVIKVRQCSSRGPILADHLSKDKMGKFEELWPADGTLGERELLCRRTSKSFPILAKEPSGGQGPGM
jgi:hypothetical protein